MLIESLNKENKELEKTINYITEKILENNNKLKIQNERIEKTLKNIKNIDKNIDQLRKAYDGIFDYIRTGYRLKYQQTL